MGHSSVRRNIARVILSGPRGKGEVSSATNHLGFRCVKIQPAIVLAQVRECPNNRRALLQSQTETHEKAPHKYAFKKDQPEK